MALYYNLPVYKASYGLTQRIFLEVENFSREYKYTTGQEMKNEAMLLIKNIYRANREIEKIPHIQQARESLEMIRLQLRLTQDFGQLDLKKFVQINQLIENVSKQLANWEKFSKTKAIPLILKQEKDFKNARISCCQGATERA